MADNDTLARPYAQAAFAVANDGGALGEMAGALHAAAALVGNDDVARLIGHPKVSAAGLLLFLQGALAEIDGGAAFAGAGSQGENFLKVLIENGRLEILPEIAQQFDALKAAAERVVDVTITAASAIDSDQAAAIKQALVERLGNDVNIETTIDEDLIGGAVIRAGDYVIDGSVRGQLTRLSTRLAK